MSTKQPPEPSREGQREQRQEQEVSEPSEEVAGRAPGIADIPGEALDLGRVDRGVLWSGLALTQTQVAELTGLSQRQVSRWVAHGLLVPSPHHPERFNGDAVEQAILMQRAIARGHRPTQASRLALLALSRQANEEQGFRVPLGNDVREKLLAAQTAILSALEILFPGGAARQEQSEPSLTQQLADHEGNAGRASDTSAGA